MAKWLRDYLNLGSRRPPPQPPTPDYTESDILRAYREQKDLDFEDPYEDSNGRPEPEITGSGDPKYNSPRHRLIKVEAADMARAKALLGSPGEEVRSPWVPHLIPRPLGSLRSSGLASVPLGPFSLSETEGRCCFCFVWNLVQHSPGWPQTNYNEFELLILLPPLPKYVLQDNRRVSQSLFMLCTMEAGLGACPAFFYCRLRPL